MPIDYDDDDAAGFGLRDVIAEEGSVNAAAGYSVPNGPWIIAPYRSVAVFVKPSGGGSFTVSVTWDQDGVAGGATATEEKSSTLTDGETLIFRNQGVQVTDVTITASANTAYAVMPSDVDPLAVSSSPVYPSHQYIDLFAQFEFGHEGAGAHAITMDALCVNGYFLQFDTQNNFLAFYFLMGPQYARHEIIFTGNKGPQYGIQKYQLASITPDAQADLGYNNPKELMESPTVSATLPTFVNVGGNVDRYAAALTRNITWGINFRVEGAPGTPLSAVSIDADGFPSIDGGPGLYMFKILMDTKNALSTGYRAGWSQITVHRIGDSGFM